MLGGREDNSTGVIGCREGLLSAKVDCVSGTRRRNQRLGEKMMDGLYDCSV